MSEAQKKWSASTNDELLQVDGNRDILASKIQEKCGIVKEDLNKQIDEWIAELKVSLAQRFCFVRLSI